MDVGLVELYNGLRTSIVYGIWQWFDRFDWSRFSTKALVEWTSNSERWALCWPLLAFGQKAKRFPVLIVLKIFNYGTKVRLISSHSHFLYFLWTHYSTKDAKLKRWVTLLALLFQIVKILQEKLSSLPEKYHSRFLFCCRKLQRNINRSRVSRPFFLT